jgi:hypothetical protein
MKFILSFLIRIYQYLFSPYSGAFRNFYFFQSQCKFEESCSNFALRVIQEKGAINGVKLAVQRISQCHPWHIHHN